jgi:hypothetical protein
MTSFVSDPQIVEGADGKRYELRIHGEAEIVRGPLGRFVDLADQITAEGLHVPPEIAAVLTALTSPKVC